MRERCWSCKKWEEHFYWDHFEESNFRFVKVMHGDFAHKMEFPQKFAKNFRVELIDVVALEAPSGKLWEIGLCREHDHFYFNGGWKTFIEGNEIEEEYTLVFEYAGDSKFLVRIFDKTGCVRAASNQPKQETVDQTRKIFRNSHSSGSGRACNDHPSLHEQATDNRSASGRGFIRDEEHGMSKVKVDRRIGPSDSKSETKIIVRNSADTLKILELKFASKKGNCSFVKLINQTSFGTDPFMTIPMKFVKKHIPEKPYGITVCNGRNRKWYVNCRWKSYCSWGFRGKPLFKLVHENKLEKGDACVFELRENGKNVVMKMHILTAKEVCSILKKSSS